MGPDRVSPDLSDVLLLHWPVLNDGLHTLLHNGTVLNLCGTQQSQGQRWLKTAGLKGVQLALNATPTACVEKSIENKAMVPLCFSQIISVMVLKNDPQGLAAGLPGFSLAMD